MLSELELPSLHVEETWFLRKLGGMDQTMPSATHILVVVNGTPTEKFATQRGLRQGDTLAHFLFTIVM